VTGPENLVEGPGLRLIRARLRMQRAVLATLTGPTDPSVTYAGSLKAKRDFQEMADAAFELTGAHARYDAARAQDDAAVLAEAIATGTPVILEDDEPDLSRVSASRPGPRNALQPDEGRS
jgi:hypothetical protein